MAIGDIGTSVLPEVTHFMKKSHFHFRKTMIALLLVAALLRPTDATLGVDVSQPISTSAFTCLKNSGISFAIVRAFTSGGSVDPSAVATIKAAHAAGIPYVDAYLFPCVSCGNPAGQVTAAISNLRINAVAFGMLWLDIENYHWSSNLAANQAFISSMISAGQAAGVKLGIYTSYYNWQSIVGLSWNGGSSHLIPLWYAHYDNVKAFSDFLPYGGWSTPSVKQYAGNVNICSVGVDMNWYP